MTAPLPTRKRRPGREYLDQPAAVVTSTPAPDNLSFLDDVYGVLSSRGEEDRRLEERKLVDLKAYDLKRDADRRADDVRADNHAQDDTKRLVQTQTTETVEEEDRQDDIRQALDKTALDDAEDEQEAIDRRKRANTEATKKPIPVFEKMPSAERIVSGFESFLKLIGAAILWSANRARQAIPPFEFGGYSAPEPFRATAAAALPEPAKFQTPSVAQAKTKKQEPGKTKSISQDDQDTMDGRAWNLGTSRERALIKYDDKRVFSVLAEVFERRSFGADLLKSQADILVKISPEVVTLLEGAYGEEPIKDFQEKFAALERRLGKPQLVAERLAETIHKRSIELSEIHTMEPAIEEEPTSPPADAGPDEEEVPENTPTATITPPKYTPRSPGGF